MNNCRRKRIREALDLIEAAKSILDDVHDEEYDAFCNLPESLQGSERGESMEENIYNLELFLDGLETDMLEVMLE